MAIITSKGIESTSLAEYKTFLEVAFRQALGSDLDVDSQTPQGQLIGIIADSLSILDDQIVLAFQQLNIFGAAGNQLDGFGATFGIGREKAFKSSVVAILAGVPTTTIEAGSQAKTTLGDTFILDADATIDNLGVGDGLFIAQETGEVPIDINTLTQVVSVIPGWETVNNPTAGTVGQLAQSDLAYRADYFEELAKNAEGTIAAIRAGVSGVDDVTSVIVRENDTGANIIVQEITLLPHSVAVVVEGSSISNKQKIGDEIYLKKTAGANTAGGDTGLQTAVTVSTNGGVFDTVIYFYPVVFVTLEITMTIKVFDLTPDISSSIKADIIAFFAGTLEPDLAAIAIADPSYKSRLYTPINMTSGFDVLTLAQEVEGSGNPEEVVTPKLNERLIVTEASIGITIV